MSKIARAVLSRNRELLRLASPDQEMVVTAETTDSLGISRVRFQQTYQGVPVFGQEASVYIERDGRVTRISGRYRPTPQIATVIPVLTSAQAEAEAVRVAGEALSVAKVDLVILPAEDTNDMTLAWHVVAYASPVRGWHFFVDAATGAVLDRYSAVQRAAVTGSGKDLDNNTVTFTAWEQGGKYYMVDVTRPGNVAGGLIKDDIGNIHIYDCKLGPTCPTAFSTALTSGWNAAVVSAISAMYSVTSYFLSTHGRKGIDDQNATILAAINDASEPDNAKWIPASQMMIFGIGGANFRNLAHTDIAGHEMTHGITGQTAQLVYKGQSGALNESFSDFFGMMIKNSGWLIGDGLTIAYPQLRSMSDPHVGLPECAKKGFTFAQPKHMNEYVVPDDPVGSDNGGVHCNSGIPNRAFYLIVEGLSTESLGTSIGRQHAEQIYYYALTQLLHQSDQFIDARRQLIKAAQLKYGANSADATAVARAFDAVGIVEPQGAVSTAIVPTDGDPVNAATWLVYRRSDGFLMAETPAGTVGPLNVYPATPQRTGMFWDAASNNAAIFYVNEQTGSLRVVDLAAKVDSLVIDADLYAFAISPNTKMIAFTFKSDSRLFIGDLATQQAPTAYQPLMPSPDGTASDVGIDVYDPAFDYLSENIVFDFTVPRTSLDGSTTYQFSFGTLNVLTGEFDTIASGQAANQQFTNPVFATNNNYVLAFDLLDSTEPAKSGVFVLNLVAHKSGFLTGLDLTGQHRRVLTWPMFNRDDTTLYFQTRNTVSGTDYNPYKVYSSAITKGADGLWALSSSGAPVSTIVGSGYPQLLIRGERSSVVHPAFTVAPAELQFPTVAVGNLAQQNVTLTNTGDVDVTITGITSSGIDFRTPSTNRLLPRGKSVVILVDFIPTAAGALTGTLTVNTDAGSKNVTLSGTGTGGVVTLSTVVEYYNASLDHYFITWVPDEITKLDAGTVIKGWVRTTKSFNTFRLATTGTSPVCRYYIPPDKGNSHFFGRGTTECNATGQKNPTFVLEDPAFMQMFLPTAGTCPANTIQVYRVFTNRPDANHRYMTDKAVRAQMVAKGWVAEGDGPDLVVMCAPL
ncbi:MAG: M4 family metallopeptidase [Betaproteobacteria bacterium]